MTLAADIREKLVVPGVCAPMMMVSGPELVAAACNAGLMAGLPVHNAASLEELALWLDEIAAARRKERDAGGRDQGVLAVNITASRAAEDMQACLDLCARQGVRVIISAGGDPGELTRRAQGLGMLVFHDVISLPHAQKAIASGVDGFICIGAGGGGHSGQINPLVLIPKIRSLFDGTIILAGAVSTGAGIRAAEVLGADLCYLGTRFIATRESRAPDAYKQMIIKGGVADLSFTPAVTGVGANWLQASLRANGLDPANLPNAKAPRDYRHLPEGVRPWKTLWSAGQGIELINDVPSVAELVERLCAEYAAACATPSMAGLTQGGSNAG